MTPFIDTAATCLFLLIASFMVRLFVHVPRNDALAAVVPAGPDPTWFWVSYVSAWTAGNHVRMLAALAASISLVVGLPVRR
jgi:uncharacterized membrane protein